MKIIKKILVVIMCAFLVLQIIAPAASAYSNREISAEPAQKSASKGKTVERDFTAAGNTDGSFDVKDDEYKEYDPIMGEIPEQRSIYEKHFRHRDGTYTAALYSSPVHYQTGSGEWKDIDNRLVLNSEKTDSSGRPAYTTTASPMDIRLPVNFAGGNKMTVGKNGHTVKIGLDSDSDNYNSAAENAVIENSQYKSPQRISNADVFSLSDEETKAYNDEIMSTDCGTSKATYPEAFNSADLVYEVTSTSVKESIIVNEPLTSYTFTFDMDLEGLTPVQYNDGSVQLFESSDDDEPCFIIEPPYMFDNDGAESNDVTMTVADDKLLISASSEWINDESRVFPVTIDPTITFAQNSIRDTYVSSVNPDTNYLRGNSLYAGKTQTGLFRTYMTIALPDLPEGSVIYDAALDLTQTGITYANTNRWIYVFDLFRNNSWDISTVTWNTQPVSSDANGPLNAGIKQVDYLHYVNSSDPVLFSFNITKSVRNWYEGCENNGLLLTSNNETANCRGKFASANNSDTSLRPSITVSYNNHIGIEDSWPFESLSEVDGPDTPYFNINSGSITYPNTDIDMSGNLVPINISHIYNSNASDIYASVYPGMYVGKRFHLNIQQILKPVLSTDPLYASGYRYEYYDSDGTPHYFIFSDDEIVGEFDPTIKINVSGNDIIIEDKDGGKKYFNSDYRLYKIEDKNDNAQIFTFTGSKITQVTDPVGRRVLLSYDNDGYLTQITDNINRVTEYDYTSTSEQALLSSITAPGDRITEYDYTDSDTDYKLVAINRANGNALTILYNQTPMSRVYSAECLDKSISFIYSTSSNTEFYSGNTTVRIWNCTNTYSFDKYGHATTKTNNINQTEYINYCDDNYNVINKAENESELQAISNNYIKNHGFEDSNDSLWVSLQHTNGSYSITNEKSSGGTKSLKMEVTAGNSVVEVDRDIYLPQTANSGYSLSLDICYMPSVSLEGDECGVRFGLAFFDEHNQEWYFRKSSWITSTSGWEQYSLPSIHYEGVCPEQHFFVEFANANPGDVAYIDNVQIENGEGPGYYNYIENGSFRLERDAPLITSSSDGLTATSWTGSNLQDRDGVKKEDAKNCFVFYGVPSMTKSICQRVELNAGANETVIVGARAGAYASEVGQDRLFQAQVQFYDENDTLKDTVTLRFDQSVDRAKQLKSTAVNLDYNCAYLQYIFTYSHQIGFACVYDTFVYVDNFGHSYSYDDSGILTGVSDGYGYSETYTISPGTSNYTEIDRNLAGNEDTLAEYTYDSNNNVTRVVNNDGSTLDYIYGQNGELLKQRCTSVSGDVSEETMTYIQNGNYVKTHTDFEGVTTTYYYDHNDQATIGLVTSEVKSNGESKVYTYDADTDELTSESNPNSGNQNSAVTITYDNGDITNINHNSTNYSFVKVNDYGKEKEIYVGQNRLYRNAYEGNRIKSSRHSYDYGRYLYDENKRLTGEVWTNNQGPYYASYSAKFGNDNKVHIVYDTYNFEPSHSFYIDYALYGLPSHVIGSDGTKSAYEYDLTGNISHFTFQKDNVMIYDGRYRMNEKGLPEDVVVSSPHNAHMQYSYDEYYRTVSESCGPLIMDYQYRSHNNDYSIDSIPVQYEVTDFSGNPIHGYSLQYDGKNNVTSVTDNNNNVTNYTYNTLSQLTGENVGSDVYTYTYDAGGNVTGVLKNNVSQHTFTYGNSAWKDQLTKYDSTNIVYNSDGCPVSYGNLNYYWVGNNLLSRINSTIKYYYTGLGKRYKKIVNGVTTEYVYSGDLLMEQVCGDDTIIFCYDYYGKPIGFNLNGASYFYVYDCLDNITNVVSSDGSTIVATYTYNAWGEILSSSGSHASVNPIRYKGYYYDEETGYYFLKTRYYNPKWHRFLSPDSDMIAGDNIFLGCNMYSYCYGNPVIYSDSEGKAPKLLNFVSNVACEVIRVGSKTIAKAINAPTTAFFNYVNEKALPYAEEIADFLISRLEAIESKVPVVEFVTKCLVANDLLGSITDIYKAPTGLRHFMPVNMNLGAPWASAFLGFDQSGKNYVSPEKGTFMWQSLVGYSKAYDYFFSLGGPVFRDCYEFQNVDGNVTTYYAVWIWKGEYWNLGAGAEIGIYSTTNRHSKNHNFYNVDTNLTLEVDMKVSYRKYGIISQELNHIPNVENPNNINWWICSFSPDEQFARLDWIDVNLMVKFTDSYLLTPFSQGYVLSLNSSNPWQYVSIPSNNNYYQFDINY